MKKFVYSTLIIILIVLLIIYTILFRIEYKKIIGLDDIRFLGYQDDYIIDKYYRSNGSIPLYPGQLKKFIKKNEELFDGNQVAEYLTNNNFGILIDSIQRKIYIYDYGFNLRDDKMNKLLPWKETHFYNYLFEKGDILIFYSIIDFSSKKINEVKVLDHLHNVQIISGDSVIY